MKRLNILKVFGFTAVLMIGVASAEETNLENDLKDLALPENVAPAGVSNEKLYSVQSRLSELRKRSELTVGYVNNYSGNGFLEMKEATLGYRYYLSNRWNLGVSGSYAFTNLSAGGQRLFQEHNMLPDAAWVKYRGALTVGYLPFYGKFRLSMEKVFYFDQYVAIGPGFVSTDKGTVPSAVADVGLILRFGPSFMTQIGVKTDFFNEKRTVSSSLEHHVLGHLDVGYTFGGSEGT